MGYHQLSRDSSTYLLAGAAVCSSITEDGYVSVDSGEWRGTQLAVTRALSHQLLLQAGVVPEPEVRLLCGLERCDAKTLDPGLLGSFLWYRPGALPVPVSDGLYRALNRQIFFGQAGFTASQGSFTAVPDNCFPSALVQSRGRAHAAVGRHCASLQGGSLSRRAEPSSHPVSPTLCLPHRSGPLVSHCVSLTVSLTVSPTLYVAGVPPRAG